MRVSKSANTVRVGDDLLTAEKIFLNTGGRASVPDLPGIHDIDYLTNSSMMDLDVLPRHLIVVGGSYVALEFAQMFRRFGAEVTVIEKSPRLAGREDEDVSAAILSILENEGIAVHVGVDDISFANERQGHRRDLTAPARRRRVGSHVLLALGRTTQHRRSRPRQGRRRGRQARLRHRRRPAAHNSAGHLGDGRLQRQGRLHPHLLQ